MSRPKKEKDSNETRWSKVSYESATYKLFLGDCDVAAIFPRETKDGKIAWGYYVKRIGSFKEINNTNYTSAPVKLEPHYTKKKESKQAIETLVKELKCPQRPGVLSSLQ